MPATSMYYGAPSDDGRRVVFTQTGGGLIDLNGDSVRARAASD